MITNSSKLSKIIVSLFVMTAIILMLSVTALAAVTPKKPSGTGTTDDPYKIGTAGELYWFSLMTKNSTSTDEEKLNNQNAVLTSDIVFNAGTITESSGSSSGITAWTPIVDYNATFDGQGHTISGLFFSDDSVEKVALFANTTTNKAEIKNLGIINSYFKGKSYVAGICANNNAIISNCFNEAEINGTTYAGGICAYNVSPIDNCYNKGIVTGSQYAGGISAYQESSNITNCNNAGDISVENSSSNSSDYVGGIVGYSKGEIHRCYNTAKIKDICYKSVIYSGGGSGGGGYSKVNGHIYVSGIAGNGVANYCYNNGEITASSSTYYYYYSPSTGYSGSKSPFGYSYGISYTANNCYNVGTLSGAAIHNVSVSGSNNFSLKNKTAEQFANGEVAYLLNGSKTGGTDFYQNLDMGTADPYPVLDDNHYRVYYYNGTYSNVTGTMSNACGGDADSFNMNMFYTLDSANNTLNLTGEGIMADYSSESPAPWAEYGSYIKYVTAEKDVQIDEQAFDKCKNIETAYIYENSPADTFFKENYPSATRKYIIEDDSVKIADKSENTFNIVIDTAVFGGLESKYIEDVRLIINNDDTDRTAANFTYYDNEKKYISFPVQYNYVSSKSVTPVRAEVIIKDSSSS
ncbi:MAG: hypothetical protein IJ583_03960, partial [Firmicutes bacterium]|nr:hypothetical protein [Bacillota bacterium]